MEVDARKLRRIDRWIVEGSKIEYGSLVTVSVKTVNCILGRKEDGWLDSDAINGCLQLIKKYFTGIKIGYALTHFFTGLEAGHHSPYNINDDELLNSEQFFIPVHRVNQWFLIVIDHRPGSKKIAIFDSIATHHMRDMLTTTTYLKKCYSDRGLARPDGYKQYSSLTRNDVPQQVNNRDCGVYTLMFAKIMASGQFISSRSIVAENIPAHRVNIAYDLVKEYIH